MAKTAVSKKSPEEHADDVFSEVARARAIGEEAFGAQLDAYGVHEICDYLEQADDDGVEEFKADLKSMIEKARAAYGTTTPTTEMVFGAMEMINDRVFPPR
jgi:hypothetical protein